MKTATQGNALEAKAPGELIEMRLGLMQEVRERRERIRAISRELDRRHDLDLAKKLTADLNPAQKEALLAELSAR